jgi:hypothetical protein
MRKPLFLVVAVAGAVVAVLRRRRVATDTALWREATSDSSR